MMDDGMMENEQRKELIEAALEARSLAYAPYSHYTVGAALLTADGKIYQGGNIENASYGATNCAERTAFFKAVSNGERRFRAIAVAGGREGELPETYAYPCGICRQVMAEFCDKEFVVIAARNQDDYVQCRLEEILPFAFGADNIV